VAKADSGANLHSVVEEGATAALEAFSSACATRLAHLPHAVRGPRVSLESEPLVDNAVDRALVACRQRGVLELERGERSDVGRILSGCLHLQVTCQGVFRAMVFLAPESLWAREDQGVVIRRCLVYGAAEGQLDTQPWALSSHSVFRRVTENAAATIEQLRPPACNTPLPAFLAWLESYRTLFTKPCDTTGSSISLHSAAHGFLPPTRRSHFAHRAGH